MFRPWFNLDYPLDQSNQNPLLVASRVPYSITLKTWGWFGRHPRGDHVPWQLSLQRCAKKCQPWLGGSARPAAPTSSSSAARAEPKPRASIHLHPAPTIATTPVAATSRYAFHPRHRLRIGTGLNPNHPPDPSRLRATSPAAPPLRFLAPRPNRSIIPRPPPSARAAATYTHHV